MKSSNAVLSADLCLETIPPVLVPHPNLIYGVWESSSTDCTAQNYRLVSLLPFIAKTLERVVFNQVTAFLTQNNLLDSNQSGSRSGHSTETALLSVVEDLRLSRTASKSSLLILYTDTFDPLTARFSCKTNTKFLFSIFYILI